jgi:hypothetical protein
MPRGFWNYQRNGLATIGEKLRIGRLVRGVGRAVVEASLNPLETAAAALRPTGGAKLRREAH